MTTSSSLPANIINDLLPDDSSVRDAASFFVAEPTGLRLSVLLETAQEIRDNYDKMLATLASCYLHGYESNKNR